MASANTRSLMTRSVAGDTDGTARPNSRASSERTANLRKSVLTSAASKGTSLLQQILGVPLIARAVGAIGFGQVSLVTASFGWVGLATLGMGPGLTQALAAEAVHGDTEQERRYFATTMALSLLAVGILLAVLVLIAGVGGIRTLRFATSPDVREALVIAAVLSLATVAASSFDAALLGYQQQYVSSTMSFFSSLVSVFLLAVCAIAAPTVSGVVVALLGPTLLARIGSGIALFRARPYLLRGLRQVDLALAVPLLSYGLWFSIISLASYATQQFMLLAISSSAGAAGVASAALMLSLSNALGSLVFMVTSPLWPALVEAAARDDGRWIRSSYARVLGGCFVFAGAAGGVVFAGGPTLTGLWAGRIVHVAPELTALFLPYFVLRIWSHVHAIFAIGLGAVRTAAIVLGLEALTAVGLLRVMPAAPPTVLLAPTAAAVMWSFWVLPVVVRRRMHSSARR